MQLHQHSRFFEDFDTMEDIDECHLLPNIEASCWKDQLKQAARQLLTTNTFHIIQSNSF